MRSFVATGLAALLLASVRPAAAGEISFVDLFRSSIAEQTAAGNSLSEPNYYLVALLNTAGDDEFTSASLSWPGAGSPQPMTMSDAKTFAFSSDQYAAQSELDAAFPAGDYTFTATDEPGDSTSVAYEGDLYPSQPYLDSTSWTDLQKMHASLPITLALSDFPDEQEASEQVIFFDVYDAGTNDLVFEKPFLPSSTNAVTIPADTLLPQHRYRYELIFSNRKLVPSPGASFDALLAWDRRTTGTFETFPVCSDDRAFFSSTDGGNDHFYAVLDTSMDFSSAVGAAAAAEAPRGGFGAGYLVTITSPQEQAFLEDCIPPRPACVPQQGPCLWTSGSDAAVEGTWRWTAGPDEGEVFYPGGYSNWQPGEPNDEFQSEDCAIYGWNHSGAWNDLPCDHLALPLVEFDPVRSCGDPLAPDQTLASDALYMLKTAVGSEHCALCICDTDDSGKVTAGDALLTLRAAVAQPVELHCPPCG